MGKDSLYFFRHRRLAAIACAAALVLAPATTGWSAPTGTGAPSAVAKRVHIGPIIFAQDYQGGKLVGQGTSFKAGIPRVYAAFTFRGLRSDDKIGDNWYRNEVRWYWDSNQVDAILGNVTEANSGTLRIYWDPDEKYVPGNYRVEIFVNGEQVQHGEFTVK
jgi:hypothetical protein